MLQQTSFCTSIPSLPREEALQGQRPLRRPRNLWADICTSSPKEAHSILPANEEAMQAGRGVCIATSHVRKKAAEAQECSRQYNNAGQMRKGSYPKTLGCLTLFSDGELHLPHVDTHAPATSHLHTLHCAFHHRDLARGLSACVRIYQYKTRLPKQSIMLFKR